MKGVSTKAKTPLEITLYLFCSYWIYKEYCSRQFPGSIFTVWPDKKYRRNGRFFQVVLRFPDWNLAVNLESSILHSLTWLLSRNFSEAWYWQVDWDLSWKQDWSYIGWLPFLSKSLLQFRPIAVFSHLSQVSVRLCFLFHCLKLNSCWLLAGIISLSWEPLALDFSLTIICSAVTGEKVISLIVADCKVYIQREVDCSLVEQLLPAEEAP